MTTPPLTDEQMIGMGRSALYVLAIWPENRIHRATLSSLAGLNRGGTASAAKLRVSLRKAERAGLIQRGDDWVDIHNHSALYRRAVEGISVSQHAKFLALEDAVPDLERALALSKAAPTITPAEQRDIEVRERELTIVRSLMGGPYDGGIPRGPRAPRVIGAGRLR